MVSKSQTEPRVWSYGGRQEKKMERVTREKSRVELVLLTEVDGVDYGTRVAVATARSTHTRPLQMYKEKDGHAPRVCMIASAQSRVQNG